MSLQSDRTLPQLAGAPFLEKPPLSYWMSAAASSVLGDNAAALRAPNLLYALVAALAVGALALRMQARAAEELARLLGEALGALAPSGVRTFFGPRRIAYAAELAAQAVTAGVSERGPRVSAPEQALAGFLRKHGAAREQLRQEGDFWVLDKPGSSVAGAVRSRLTRRILVRPRILG